MSRRNTTVVVDPRDPSTFPPSRTDWSRVDAMTDAQVTEAACSDPDALPLDDAALAKMARPPDVRAIRALLGLSQSAFARRFDIDVRTVQEWEQGRRRPDRAARALLTIIEREPEAASRALAR